MRRREENGRVSFDHSEDLGMVQEELVKILAMFNPSHPNTLQAIMNLVEWYGQQIDGAWSTEYSNRTLQDAQQGTPTMISAVLAGMEVGRLVVPEGTGRVLEGRNGMGEELAVYIDPGPKPPCVTWVGMGVLGDVSLYTRTREEAGELFSAMLKITDCEVD